MRKIVITTNASLDGVVQDPDGQEGFRLDGWFGQFGGNDLEAWAKLDEWFASRWNGRAGEWADKLNSMPKYVVSSTLEHPHWRNATILNGDVVAGISKLKQALDGEILVYASYQLVHTLLEHDLIDELRLVVFPVVLGAGKRLFGETTDKKPLRLSSTRTLVTALPSSPTRSCGSRRSPQPEHACTPGQGAPQSRGAPSTYPRSHGPVSANSATAAAGWVGLASVELAGSHRRRAAGGRIPSTSKLPRTTRESPRRRTITMIAPVATHSGTAFEPAGGKAGVAVALRAVQKVYGRNGSAVRALDGVDIDFDSGTFTAVMGPSGSGKSTLLQCAAGLDRPSAGTVWLAGSDLAQLSETGLTKLRRTRVGFVFQAFNLVSALTVRENILLPSRLAHTRPDRRWLSEVVARVGLNGRLRHRPAQLSGGEQQRVAIARALSVRPAVIFCDEPTGALDTTTAAQVLTLLRQAVDVDGQTVVMVTHDPVAASYADRVVLLADGRIADDMLAPRVDTIADRLVHLGGSRSRGGEPAW